MLTSLYNLQYALTSDEMTPQGCRSRRLVRKLYRRCVFIMTSICVLINGPAHKHAISVLGTRELLKNQENKVGDVPRIMVRGAMVSRGIENEPSN